MSACLTHLPSPIAHPHTQPIHLITYLLFTAWYLLIVFSFFIQDHIHQFFLPFYQLQLSILLEIIHNCCSFFWKTHQKKKVLGLFSYPRLTVTQHHCLHPAGLITASLRRICSCDLRMRSTVGLGAARRAAASEEARSVNCAALPRAALPAYSRGSVSQIAVISVLAR